MTIEELQAQNTELIRQLHDCEQEIYRLRTLITQLQDDNCLLRRHAELGETTEKFLSEIKRILR